ncbi:MAG: phosphatidylglycerol lysyltransferase [Treponema sp.]|nr:phosphatidylglycerol lysyltransferase [Treponema sp.]
MNTIAEAELKKAIDKMIFSPSGWRGIFNSGGDEENPGVEIATVYKIITAAAAVVFSEYLIAGTEQHPATGELPKPPVIILGTDTRPTGKTIADIMIRSFLVSGCSVQFAGITAAPEIMAYARSGQDNAAGGFCYISASHNPIGHNGFKFGLFDGGVLEGLEANKLIESFKNFMASDDSASRISALLDNVNEDKVRQVYAESQQIKEKALAAYRSFSEKVIYGESPQTGALKQAMIDGLKTFPLKIAADFNGSARTVSIDEELFGSLGLGFHKINASPGEIAHAIIPEGDSLESCRRFLEELNAKDPSVLLGYMPDCDGDRGNLVIWDKSEEKGRSLEAQEVFALACMAELAHLVWTGELEYDNNEKCITKAAVAVNGPTSMRIDRIAKAFGVEVFRAEVGEANVVNLARNLRNKGYLVRILGEGSNGGNITHPSSVRDPLATVFALVKLLTIRRGGVRNAGLFEIWKNMRKTDLISSGTVQTDNGASDNFSLDDIIASLPPFQTTSVSAPEAKLQVTTRDHALLKSQYQKIFEKEWNEKKDKLMLQYNITGWEARSCIGTEEKQNLSDFSDAESGGLKIVFKNKENDIAFIWMRGSKTEPVFRIMADAENPELERELIAWQRAMTTAADNGKIL